VNEAVGLLKRVIDESRPGSVEAVWGRYLLAISGLFSGDLDGRRVFENHAEADAAGMGLLYRAEQMEFARKAGEANEAIAIANTLLGEFGEDNPEALDDTGRYVVGVAAFLLGNLLRHGGRYDAAFKWIDKAEKYFKSVVASHATEIAHCFYAKHVCIAMTGVSSFFPMPDAPSRADAQRFATALIRLSYSHAAWFIEDIERASQHASEAAKQFRDAGTPRYADRAAAVNGLLSIWRVLKNGARPDYSLVPADVGRGVATLVGRNDREFLERWLPSLRPSTALGLLQFAKEFSPVFSDPLRLPLPRRIATQSAGPWVWADAVVANSLKEADQVLREHLSVPGDRRVPLIAD
jgi:hypothetical protein